MENPAQQVITRIGSERCEVLPNQRLDILLIIGRRYRLSVCADDADILFESCDHVVFKIHSANLRNTTETLCPPAGTITHIGDTVALTESAKVLDLMFQYMYPQRQPNLREIEFDLLEQLSEAAEKYQVFSALEVCKMCMEDLCEDYPFEVLLYASRHGYTDMADAAAYHGVAVSPIPTFNKLLIHLPTYVAYTQYYAQWLEAARLSSQYKFIEGSFKHSQAHLYRWACIAMCLANLPVLRLESTEALFDVVETDACAECDIAGWRDHMHEQLDSIKPYTTFT